MAYSFESFKVDIAERPFVRSDGFTTPQTAIITLLNAKGGEITTVNLACPNIADMYEQIGQNSEINLNNCYIRGFSITACKRYLLTDKSSLLKINNFIAQGSFFDSCLNIDFSLIEFTGDVNFDDSYFVGRELDFHSSKIDSNFNFTNCYVKVDKFLFTQGLFNSGNITFKNTIFDNGIKDFQDINFGNGDVNFTNTDFGDGDVSFINARFNSCDVSFKVARFGKGKVDFHFAKFGNGAISFERAEFGQGRVDFRTVEFGSGKTSFNRAVFSDGEVNFEGAEATSGKVTFKRAIFGNAPVNFELYQGRDSELIFERSTFPSDVSFRAAQLGNLELEECQFNSTLNLHVDKCDVINLAGCTFRDIVEFYTHGDHPKVKILDLAGIRLLGQFYIDWEDNDLKNLIYNQPNTSVIDKAEQFRILKENFNALGKYSEEDKAYVEFKRCELKANLKLKSEKGFFSRLFWSIDYGARMLLFDYMGLYATAPQRVILSIIIVYALYSFAYFLTMVTGAGTILASSAAGESLSLIAKSFYFSVVTFFTIGYGDFAPEGIARIIAGTEGFVGVFLMSYFTVAFVRKILR